jgi:hypothetical protein
MLISSDWFPESFGKPEPAGRIRVVDIERVAHGDGDGMLQHFGWEFRFFSNADKGRAGR